MVSKKLNRTLVIETIKYRNSQD